MEGLVQCTANCVPLSPISFLEQAAFVYGERVSIIYGNTRYSWRQTHDRCLKLASALSLLGIRRGHVVAALAPNIPALYELHFGVPMSGGVLSALNTKLDAAVLASLLEQLEAKAIFVDTQCVEVVVEALETLSQLVKSKPPILILIPERNDDDDDQQVVSSQLPVDSLTYSGLLSMGGGQTDFKVVHPENECDPISVSYTSGSTGMPKGVVYSHRAAYLNSLAVNFRFDISTKFPVFLWTVDMFRCNGWCFTWALAALCGTNICIRNVTAQVIFDAIALHKVTHMCGAPTILNKIAEASNYIPSSASKVEIVVAGVLPPFRVVTRVEALGFNVTHAYGMTEALGPVTFNKFQQVPDDHRSAINIIRYYPQGILHEQVDVKDWVSMKSVPADGKTIGEVMFRSNTMMSGYLKNMKGTRQAFKGGWYRTGDLGIRHPDGSIQMKDRAIDMIKSGGETISSLEVEAVLVGHPKVLEAAVVARPDNILGETPCAFVKLKEGFFVDDYEHEPEHEHAVITTEEEIIKFCMEVLPHYMAPKTVIFDDLPVNSTGKIQKLVLREKAFAMGSLPNTPSA